MSFLNLQRWFNLKKARAYTRLLRSDFSSIGKNSIVYPPFHSGNASNISIGDNCTIFNNGWIECVPAYGSATYDPKIEIGDNTYIGFRVHIIACGHMKIGKNVVFADGIYVSDNLHGFEDINTPVMTQPLSHPGPVTIEDEVWLGEGVCVLPNVTIGKHSVIGSNSVVTKDIPPYSVAVGVPAKVIKRYNHDTGKWERA